MAPVDANPKSGNCLSSLPHAADELLNGLHRIFADSVGSCTMNFPVYSYHLDRASHSPCHDQPESTLIRAPKLSILGFASLLLGISFSLMLIGSLAFFLGFMLMPLIMPTSIAVCVGASLATLSKSLGSLGQHHRSRLGRPSRQQYGFDEQEDHGLQRSRS